MIRPRYLVAGALAALTVGPVCSVAQAQAPNCGGNSTVHPAPIDCENTRTISGIKGKVRLVVDETGYVMVTAVVQAPLNVALPPLFLQVKAHRGVSSNAGFEGGTDVFDGNTASLELTMPRSLEDNCTSQIDVKIAPGQPTEDHISPNFRFAAPLVGIDLAYCQPSTVPTTAPTSSPTTSPEPGSPTTSMPGGGSTTVAPTASSVVGGTLPATGPSQGQWNAAGLALFFFIPVGLFLAVVATRKRSAS